MNVSVLLILGVLAYIGKVSGLGFCLGGLFGYALFFLWFRVKHGYWP